MELFDIQLIDLVGYSAMAFLLISFLMKDVNRLRVIISIGCAFFVVYGFLLVTSWPIIITNSAIISINLYCLILRKN